MDRLKQEVKASRARAEAAKLGLLAPANGDAKSPISSPLPDREINGSIVKLEDVEAKISDSQQVQLANVAGKKKVRMVAQREVSRSLTTINRVPGIRRLNLVYGLQKKKCQIPSSLT